VVGIFGPAKAGFHNGKPRLHEHDKKAGDEGPNEVDGNFILADLIHQVTDRRALLRVGHSDVACCAGERAVRIAFGPGVRTWYRSTSDIGIGDCLWRRRGRRRGVCAKLSGAKQQRAPKHSVSRLLVTIFILVSPFFQIAFLR